MNESRLPSDDSNRRRGLDASGDDDRTPDIPEPSTRTPDIIDAGLEAIEAEPIPSGPPRELLMATAAALAEESLSEPDGPNHVARPGVATQSTEKFPQPSPLSRSPLMKAFSTTLGLLATVATVFGVAAVLQQPNQAYAFTHLMQQIRDAKMVSYHQMLYAESNPDGISIKEYQTADGRRRSEQGLSTTVFRADGFIDFSLTKGIKSVLYPSVDRPMRSNGSRRNFIKELKAMQAQAESPEEDLGERQIDGRTVHGFAINKSGANSGSRYQLWIDPNTNELVELVREVVYDGRESKTVLTDFEFYDEVDESLFQVPEGYTEPKKPSVPFAEQQTVNALRDFTRYSDGVLPDSLTDMTVWFDKFQTKETGGFGNRDSNSAIRAIAQTVIMLSRIAPGDYGYPGAGSAAGDADEIVFWYRTEDGDTRAIFGDFHSRELTAEEVNELADSANAVESPEE